MQHIAKRITEGGMRADVMAFSADIPYRTSHEDRTEPTRLRFVPSRAGAMSSLICPECGLWWARGRTLKAWAATDKTVIDHLPALCVLMREPVNSGCLVGLAIVSLIGLGGAWVILSSLEYASEDGAWFGLFVSLPLGLFSGSYALLALASFALHHIAPSRLDGDSDVLRLRIWHTWSGILSNFRRVDTRIRRAHLHGIAVGSDQGGQSQLFLAHASGWNFYAGFTGSREELDSIAADVQRWLRAPSAIIDADRAASTRAEIR